MYVLYLFVLILLNAKHGTTKAKFTRLGTTKAKFTGVGTFFKKRFPSLRIFVNTKLGI